MTTPFASLQLTAPRSSVREAFNSTNQRVQPVRPNSGGDVYEQMVKKLSDKPSVREIVLSYSHS
ncbi:hypothetical protein ACMGT0_05555 [Pseudomonas sp. RHF3.3-3]|uniref:hypothetical protein n=1 Tax=Pseudomonas sp. RHF3.3-3 TaxID=3396624 RepID=UPI003A8B710B